MFSKPLPTNRVVVAGPTRCGKSTLMAHMLSDYTDVLQVHFKDDFKLRKGELFAKDLRGLERALNKARDEGLNVVYRVPKEHMLPHNASKLDEVAKMMLERSVPESPSILCYHDLVYVAGSSDFWKRAPHYYFAVTTGGGKGLGVWAGVQRPAGIPMVALSESDIRISFYLRKATDRDRMEELLGDEIPWDYLRRWKRTFVYGTDMETHEPTMLKFKEVAA